MVKRELGSREGRIIFEEIDEGWTGCEGFQRGLIFFGDAG
jgi:hypothetical protein